MSKRTSIVAAVAIALAGATACTQPLTREESGTVIGGIVGGVLGHQVGHGSGRAAATVAGAVVGALVGGALGRSMDDTDRLRTMQALEHTPTGVPSRWRNPDTGHSYTVVPKRTYERSSGPCREYVMQATVGGRREDVYGTACRQPDGSWRAVS